jgi:protein-S-isoprenylcysteine O-methyltransferase Ste14
MNALELKLPPLLQCLLALLLMWLLARVLPALSYLTPGRRLVAMLAVAVGIAVALAGVLAFRRAHTTLNPTRPGAASAVVAQGVYRYTRNPMYLGMLLVLAGAAVWLSNLSAWAVLPAFVAYMNRFQILPEERALAAKFGPGYADYARSVRRWI